MYIAFVQRTDGAKSGVAFVGEDRDEVIGRAFAAREDKELRFSKQWRVIVGLVTEEVREKKQYDFIAIEG